MRPPVLVGVVTAAHGIAGEVKVKSFTADPAALGSYGPLSTGDGRKFVIAKLRPHRADELILRLENVVSRNDAEALKGLHLYVPRVALPDAQPGEYYHADFVGMLAQDQNGATLGRITAVLNFGAGDILELTTGTGGTELIPFDDRHVPQVDLAGERIVVDIPSTDEDEDPE